MQSTRRHNPIGVRWIAAILLPYVILLVLVPPVGEFPTGDDFDYAACAWHLAETGQLTLSDWPAMTLVTHVAWGALICKFGGSSFVSLRCAQFLLSCIAALAIDIGFLRRGHTQSLAALAAVCFAVNPLTVSLEYTFLTDITGAALCAVLISAAPMRREQSVARLTAYSMLAGLAYLSRETAAIPWIMLSAATGWDCLSRRSSWRRFVWLIVPAGLMVLAYETWLRSFQGIPYNRSLPPLNWAAMDTDRQRLIYLASGLGLALSPVACALLVWLRQTASRRLFRLPILIGLAASVAVCCGINVSPPYRGELFDLGLRIPEAPTDSIPAPLRGPVFSLAGFEVPLFRITVTGLAWLIAATLAIAICLRRGIIESEPAVKPRGEPRLATGTFLGTAGLYLVTIGAIDRYLLALLPAALLMLAELLPLQALSSRALKTGWIAAIVIGGMSVIGIQDGMARSRCFWAATDQLLQQGVSPDAIDAGLAFGGMYRFNPVYRGDANTGPFWTKLGPHRWDETVSSINPLTSSDDRPFRVSFGDEDDYARIDAVPFESWLRSGEVIIYRRAD